MKPHFPPLLLLYTMLAMAGLDQLAPWREYLEWPWTLAGLPVLAAGFALVALCVPLFKRAETRLRPAPGSTAMITTGPYRFTRNPIYLGMAVMLLGFGVMLGSLTPLLMVPLFMALIHVVWIRREERWMREVFGAEYDEYRRRVRAWF